MNYFKLPDLGEGLQEAEIVEWKVKSGDEVVQDQVLVAVETAKAIVDLPSPQSGKIHRLYGNPGDVIHVGDPLVEFEEAGKPREDAGSVVGEVKVGHEVVKESAQSVAFSPLIGVKATPAVRALAARLDVDLSIVTPSGPDGTVTAADVQRVAKILAEVGPIEPLRGVRRTMARTMSQSHSEVAAVTICDDVDIGTWGEDEDITVRLIRALVAGCAAEPSLNAWYDSHAVGRRVLKKIDLGIAVDTGDGLFVPVLRDVAGCSRDDLRRGLDAIKDAVKSRSVAPEDMRGYTIILSNFGTFAGRYATPVVVPPTVAIVGAGKIRPEMVVAGGEMKIGRILPLSLTFDHRAVTGGEAARFLGVMIEDLAQPE